MLAPGPARKVTIHLNEDTSARHDFLYKELFEFLYAHGIAGATVIRPDAGFGSHHQLHSTGAGSVAGEHLPIRIEFLESQEIVAAILPALCELVTDGLIETQETTIVKSARQALPI